MQLLYFINYDTVINIIITVSKNWQVEEYAWENIKKNKD